LILFAIMFSGCDLTTPFSIFLRMSRKISRKVPG
jgi:hypothetical protein